MATKNPPSDQDAIALTITAEDAAVERELRLLDLDEKRENAERRRALRDQRIRTRESTEASLADARAQDEARQELCSHRKGGIGQEATFSGSSNFYSVVKHMLPHGELMVLCQRCHKEWRRPSSKGMEKAEYAEALRDYRKAINLPTDNVQSGTQLFVVNAA